MRSTSRNATRRTAALLGCTALTIAIVAAAPASAQTAPAADDGDAIVVTGIRGSLESSARLKRATPTIVESISAEDIGKLPDVSIADSLARLPGVTAQRLEGRDQRLSIRGLGPDFSTTLLNGREQVTVGDNRGVEYDQYPSEFFQNVVVNKSADASLIAAGIAGTVDLRMLRPLDQKRTISLRARGQMNGTKNLNPDSPRYGYRASATYIDKFADDTLGIAIGVSAASTPSQNERYNAWGFPNAPEVGGALLLGGAKPYVQSNLLTRYGIVGTVQYEPSDNWHSTLDVLYSNFKETQKLRGIEFPINPGWGSGATVQPGFTVSNGLATSVTLSNVYAVQRNDINKRTAENLSIGWNNKFKLGDRVNLTVDASWSRATRTDFLLETYTGTGYNGAGARDTIKITQNPNGTFKIVPTLDYTNTGAGGFGITDPRGWGFNGTTTVVQAGFLNRPDFKDDLKSLRASLDGEFANAGVLKGWEIGANYSRREKTSAYKSYFLCPKGGGTNCTVASGTPTFVAVPDAAKKGTLSLDYLGVPKMLVLDPLYLYNNTLNPVFDNRPGSLVRDNVITEKVITGYAKLNLDGQVGDKHLAGSIGVQIVHTKQDSVGTLAAFNVVAGIPQVTIAPARGGATYTNVNPSAALSLELMNNFFVKMSASHTMVRARLDQERVNQEVSINFTKLGNTDPGDSGFSSNGGNPSLRPYQSTNLDLSLEKYFAKGGYFALAGYFKDLTDFVDVGNATVFDFTALATALKTAIPSVVIGTNLGRLQQPGNTGKGYIIGTEATLSLPFSNLSESLDGFGFFGSASYTDSRVKLGQTSNVITVPGLSDWVANASLYYEKHGFQVRGSYRYRSGFLGEVAGLSANPTFRQANAEVVVDAQIGYEFQNGPLKGLAILLEGKNLTDRPFVTYQNNDPRQVIDYQRYGRDYYLGVSYKF